MPNKAIGRGFAATSFTATQGFITLNYLSAQGANTKVFALSQMHRIWHQYGNNPLDKVEILAFDNENQYAIFYINPEDAIFDGSASTPTVPTGADASDVFAILTPFVPIVAPTPTVVPSVPYIVNIDDTTPTFTIPANCKSWTIIAQTEVTVEIGTEPAVTLSSTTVTNTDMTNTLEFDVIVTQSVASSGQSATIAYLV